MFEFQVVGTPDTSLLQQFDDSLSSLELSSLNLSGDGESSPQNTPVKKRNISTQTPVSIQFYNIHLSIDVFEY